MNLKCKFCERETNSSSSNKNHERRCRSNPNRIIEQLTADGKKRKSEAARKQNAAQWTTEFRKKHSKAMKKAVEKNPDSYSKNNVSGRVKIVEYKGHKLKGSWEVKTAKWLDSQSIKWKNEVNPQPYFWNNSWHLYFPDFWLEELDIYIEVKGYKTERDNAKWSQFKGTLLIVDSQIIDNLDDLTINDLPL